MKSKKQTLLPKFQKTLEKMGENIKLPTLLVRIPPLKRKNPPSFDEGIFLRGGWESIRPS